MGFAFVMGTISSSVILFVIFFLVITPVGIVMRLFGRDSLALKAEGKDSFWSDHPPLDDKTYYERLF
ncbi:MAG: hypothetical protein JO102_06165 [Elusimicrobia bacterium]|nr:hypothetical protein [Elusimicrobiota bacterium]